VLCVYVLRLLPQELADGRIVGQVEEVESKNTSVIHNVEELRAFLTGASGEREADRR
jgi:hypothetical protein